MSGVEADVLARATWSALVEPGDVVAGALVELLGAAEALAWVRRSVQAGRPDVGRLEEGRGQLAPGEVVRIGRALARWAARLPDCEPRRDLDRLERLGGAVLVPGDPGWSVAVDDLGVEAPFCL